MQAENQTFIPNQLKIGIKRPEDQPPQPELRNLAGGKPSLQAESGTQKPNLFEDSGKGPTPVYKMDKDDWDHRETYCPAGPAQVPLYQTRAIKEAGSCHFSPQPNVHNFRQGWLNMKKEVAKASGEPEEGYAWISKVVATVAQSEVGVEN